MTHRKRQGAILTKCQSLCLTRFNRPSVAVNKTAHTPRVKNTTLHYRIHTLGVFHYVNKVPLNWNLNLLQGCGDKNRQSDRSWIKEQQKRKIHSLPVICTIIGFPFYVPPTLLPLSPHSSYLICPPPPFSLISFNRRKTHIPTRRQAGNKKRECIIFLTGCVTFLHLNAKQRADNTMRVSNQQIHLYWYIKNIKHKKAHTHTSQKSLCTDTVRHAYVINMKCVISEWPD